MRLVDEGNDNLGDGTNRIGAPPSSSAMAALASMSHEDQSLLEKAASILGIPLSRLLSQRENRSAVISFATPAGEGDSSYTPAATSTPVQHPPQPATVIGRHAIFIIYNNTLPWAEWRR
jgi:hypothetical protein